MAADTDLASELDRYLAAAPAAARVAEESLTINTRNWEASLSGMPVPVEVQPVDGVITRTALFGLAQVDRQERSDRSLLQLFWNIQAWGIAGSWRNVSRLVAEVEMNTAPVLKTLREAQTLSFEGSESEAFRTIQGAIRYFGPAFFTKFLYFTADKDRVGHALILDDRVCVAWRILAGYQLRNGSSEDYARYCTEAGQAGQRLGLSGSEVEACLYHFGRKVSSYEKWSAANLRLCQTRLADRAPTIADVVAEFDKRS